MNEGRDPGLTHIVAKGTSDFRSKARRIVTCYLVSTAPGRFAKDSVHAVRREKRRQTHVQLLKRNNLQRFVGLTFTLHSSPWNLINEWYKQVIPCLFTGFTVNVRSTCNIL